MSESIITVAWETFTLLRRDRVFVPALLCGILIAVFANLASDWSIEDFRKILLDVGIFGWQFTGGAVAIFWGTALLGHAQSQGALEMQLAAPIGRGPWLIAKFLGLSIALLFLAAIMLLVWQALMLLNRFGPMNARELYGFVMIVLEWHVLAALALLMASFVSTMVAVFCSVCLWIVGLSCAAVSEQIPALSLLAKIWNLQLLNAHSASMANVQYVGGSVFFSEVFCWRLIYAVGLVSLLLAVAVVVFRRRDLLK